MYEGRTCIFCDNKTGSYNFEVCKQHYEWYRLYHTTHWYQEIRRMQIKLDNRYRKRTTLYDDSTIESIPLGNKEGKRVTYPLSQINYLLYLFDMAIDRYIFFGELYTLRAIAKDADIPFTSAKRYLQRYRKKEYNTFYKKEKPKIDKDTIIALYTEQKPKNKKLFARHNNINYSTLMSIIRRNNLEDYT